MGLTLKTVLDQETRKQASYFVLSDRNKLTFRQSSGVPWGVFHSVATQLQKTEEKISEKATLGFIYEMDLDEDDLDETDFDPTVKSSASESNSEDLSSDESKRLLSDSKPKKEAEELPKSAHSFYWKTTQENMQQAVDYGITPFEALTSRVIGALGIYRLKVFERAYDYGIISDKYEEKELWLRITQTRIRHLQALERLVNAYDHGIKVAENSQRIQATFKAYQDRLDELKNDINEHELELNKFDSSAAEKLRSQIETDSAEAKAYQKHYLDNRPVTADDRAYFEHTVLSASGPKSIAQFIKVRMIAALRQVQEHNQNMTYSRKAGSLFRGEFNSYCEDALRVINNYLCDHHNPVTPEHQGYFSTNPDHPITLDFRHLGKNRRTVRQYIMAITQIEGADSITKNPSDEYILSGLSVDEPNQKILKTTRFTSWGIQAKWSYPVKRVAYWIWNVLMGVVIGLIDLPFGLIAGIKGVEPTSNVARFRLEFTPECAQKTQFHELAEKIDFPAVSLGAKLGSLIGSILRNTVWELFKGVRTSLQRSQMQLGQNLKTDYEIGHHGLPSDKDIYALVEGELESLKTEETRLLGELDRKHHSLVEKLEREYGKHYDGALFTSTRFDSDKKLGKIQPDEIVGQFAQAPYALDAGEWTDILNSALGGFNYAFDVILHDIHVKHPFSGICFNAFYIIGGLVVVYPESFAFLGKDYLAVSKAIADASSSGLLTGANSSSFYQGLLAGMVPELLVNGRNSWLISGLSSLEEEPSEFIAYGALAVGIGAILAYGIKVPYISEGIKAELGTVPAIGLGFAGAKFSIILFELFETETCENEKDSKAQRARLKLILKEHYQEKYALTDQEMNEIVEALLNPELINKIKAQLGDTDITQLKAVSAQIAEVDEQALRVASEKVDEATEQYTFFKLLQQHQHLLPHLDYRSKRLLIELMHQKRAQYPQGVAAMQKMLFPEQKRSIMDVTVSTVLDYFPALGRCFTTIVTWDKEPWRHLGNKIVKDLGRVFHAGANKILKPIAHNLRVTLRIVFDVLGNEIFARVEGLLRNDAHSLSAGTYKVSTEVDCSYETAKEFLAQPVDGVRKFVTHPDPQSFFPRVMHQSQFGLSAKKQSLPQKVDADFSKGADDSQSFLEKSFSQKGCKLFDTSRYPRIKFFGHAGTLPCTKNYSQEFQSTAISDFT